MCIRDRPLSGVSVQTEVLILPQLGCTYLSAKIGAQSFTLQATSHFQRADIGVPAWEAALHSVTSLHPKS